MKSKLLTEDCHHLDKLRLLSLPLELVWEVRKNKLAFVVGLRHGGVYDGCCQSLEVCLATLLVLAFGDFKVNTKMVRGKAESLR